MSTLINPMRDFGLAGVLQPGANLGKIVYVNLGGLDANDGLGPSRPKLTIRGALDVCTDDLMDTIVVLDYWDNDAVWPISVDVSRVRIIGSPSGNFLRPWAAIVPTGDVAAIDIAANDVFIQGLYLQGGATAAGISIAGASIVRTGIFDCWFGPAAYGIEYSGMGGFGHVAARNFFSQSVTANGILYSSNSPFSKFEDNIFEQIADIGFYTQGAAAACSILNNIFSLPSNTQGKAITLDGSTSRWIVYGNRANYGVTTMAGNPYEDASSGVNHWLTNWNGTAAVDPA